MAKKKTFRERIAERTGGGLTRKQRSRANLGVQALVKARKEQGLKPLNQIQLSKKRGEFEKKAKKSAR